MPPLAQPPASGWWLYGLCVPILETRWRPPGEKGDRRHTFADPSRWRSYPPKLPAGHENQTDSNRRSCCVGHVLVGDPLP